MATIYNPTSGALARTPILCKIEDAGAVDFYSLSIKVWTGNKGAVPATAEFNLQKYPDKNGVAVFDISQLLQGYFSSVRYKGFTDFSQNPNQVIWVQCTYVETIAGVAGTPIVGGTFAVYDGYGEFIEGVNPVVDVIASSQINDIHLIEGSYYALATSQADVGIGRIEVIFDIGGNQDIVNLFTNLNLTQDLLLYTDISPSRFNGLYDKSYTVKVWDAADSEILDTISVKVECEPKFTPVTIAFINKNGAWDYLTFSKARKEMIDVESADFMPYMLDTSFGSAPSYDTGAPQIKKYDINANESITLNTTFLPEAYYETIKQIMMSKRCVWIEKDLSVNPKTMNMVKKSSVNKEMIQYTIDFTFASLTQSTVR